MKLLLCTQCGDVFKLGLTPRDCGCGACGGTYAHDGLNATYWGDCVPIGFANSSLVKALKNRPREGRGECFEAFVIPSKCPTMEKIDR